MIDTRWSPVRYRTGLARGGHGGRPGTAAGGGSADRRTTANIGEHLSITNGLALRCAWRRTRDVGGEAVAHGSDQQAPDPLARSTAEAQTVEDLAELLRTLRRRHARQHWDGELTYRELAAKTGWSHTAIAEYFTGRTLPPTDRFDALVALLGASPAEQGALATARDRVEERRRTTRGSPCLPAPPVAAPRTRLDGHERPVPASGRGRGRIVPRQLPAAGHFVGRAAEMLALAALLDQPSAAGTVTVSTIGGPGGIGKTWLALHWAHHNRRQFPDGQLYVNLRGYDPSGEPMVPGEAVRGFLDALGVEPTALPVDLEAQAGLYRSLVADRRMLIVLDNARDAAQVVPLLPGDGNCTVLVTSRRRLDGLITAFGARSMELGVLPDAEGLELLTRNLGEPRVDAEPEAAAELLHCCGGLPLAIAVVAARATSHPLSPLAAIAAELRDAPARLDALAGTDLTANVRAVLSWSYHALEPAEATVFGLLALAPGPDISVPAAASLLALPIPTTRVVLRGLEGAYLVQNHAPDRYRMHDLVHLYAVEQAHRDLSPDCRTAALRRLVDFFLHTAHAGDRHLAPQRPSIALEQSGSGPAQPLPDSAEALAWFDAEHASLLATHLTAAAHGWYTQVWQLAWTLNTFHNRRGHLHNQVAAWQLALTAAEHLADPAALAMANRWLGHAYGQTARPVEAVRHLHNALTLSERTGDTTNQAHTHHLLAHTWEEQGDDERALSHARQALDLYRTLGNPVWQAQGLNAVGWYQARLGHYGDARVSCQAALTVHRQHGYRDGEGGALDSLGYIAYHAGRHEEAITYYRHALTTYRDGGDTYTEAHTLDRLGHAHAALEQHEQAGHAWRRALLLYRSQHRAADAARVERQLAGYTTHTNLALG
jgi:tetratricopeptide (TPR) repeat protein/transcriptional regulator with XRE-family HTH domain